MDRFANLGIGAEAPAVPTYPQVMPGRPAKAIAAVYYGGLSIRLVLIVAKALPHLLPHTIAIHVVHDSEGYVLKLLLPAWIDYARPRLAGSPPA